MKANIISVLVVLLALGLTIGGSSCKKKEESAVITLGSPNALSLVMGQSCQLQASVSPEAQLSWASEDPTVAQVDANGLVTAVKSGATKISVTAPHAKEVSVSVSVKATELPVIHFLTDLKDRRKGFDDLIESHEQAVGRKYNKKLEYNAFNKYPGFANTELSTISAVIYCIAGKPESPIMCFVKEEYDKAERCAQMLKDLGFEGPVQPADKTLKYRTWSRKDGVEAKIYPFFNRPNDSKSMLEFRQKKKK
ncbi:MAG: Ig-like domain-containing protein [Porphyromonas sp.]|nr:Ig-like domain-containing protein [Porphyromonas sp.]